MRRPCSSQPVTGTHVKRFINNAEAVAFREEPIWIRIRAFHKHVCPLKAYKMADNTSTVTCERAQLYADR